MPVDSEKISDKANVCGEIRDVRCL
eukprot:SAG11_NODE_32922_length_280_cov_0.569061_1_plen_24_part_10